MNNDLNRIAELEEQLRVAKDWCEHYRKQCVEAAMQEPVAFLNLAAWKQNYSLVFATPERAFDNQDALYALPPIRELSDEEINLLNSNVPVQVDANKELKRAMLEAKVEMVKMIFEERVNSSNFETFGYYLHQIIEELHAELASLEGVK